MTGELPDAAVACVGGGSNAMGLLPDSLTSLSNFMVSSRSDAARKWANMPPR